jgi:hypothetical protein
MTFEKLTLAALLILRAGAGQAAPQASAIRFYELIRSNDLKGLQAEVQRAGVDVRDDHGATPLMHAAAIGSVDAVRLLLGAAADVNAKNAFDATALTGVGVLEYHRRADGRTAACRHWADKSGCGPPRRIFGRNHGIVDPGIALRE